MYSHSLSDPYGYPPSPMCPNYVESHLDVSGMGMLLGFQFFCSLLITVVKGEAYEEYFKYYSHWNTTDSVTEWVNGNINKTITHGGMNITVSNMGGSSSITMSTLRPLPRNLYSNPNQHFFWTLVCIIQLSINGLCLLAIGHYLWEQREQRKYLIVSVGKNWINSLFYFGPLIAMVVIDIISTCEDYRYIFELLQSLVYYICFFFLLHLKLTQITSVSYYMGIGCSCLLIVLRFYEQIMGSSFTKYQLDTPYRFRLWALHHMFEMIQCTMIIILFKNQLDDSEGRWKIQNDKWSKEWDKHHAMVMRIKNQIDIAVNSPFVNVNGTGMDRKESGEEEKVKVEKEKEEEYEDQSNEIDGDEGIPNKYPNKIKEKGAEWEFTVGTLDDSDSVPHTVAFIDGDDVDSLETANAPMEEREGEEGGGGDEGHESQSINVHFFVHENEAAKIPLLMGNMKLHGVSDHSHSQSQFQSFYPNANGNPV